MRLGWGIPAAFVFAAIVLHAFVARAPSRLSADFAQPLVVVTNWGVFGALLLGVLFLALALATVAYLLGMRSAGSLWKILMLCAVALACAWLVPVSLSSDVYAYAAYGELARLGSDPYGHAALARGNPIFDAAVWQWGNPPPACVYGPLFVAIARLVVEAAAPLGVLAQLDGLRLVSSGALVACGLLAYGAFPGDRAARAAAAATIVLNPVAIWCAAEGHNDALAVAIVLAGFALARTGWFGTGAAVAALSGLVKIPGIAAAIPLALRDRRALTGATGGIALAAIASLPLLEGALAHVAPAGRYAPQASFQAIVEPLVFMATKTGGVATVVTWAIAALAAAACAVPGVRALRSAQPEGWAYLAAGGWLLVPNPYPWYALWLLPIAALAPGTRPAAVLLGLSLTSFVRYVPDAVAVPAPAAAVVLGVVATLPLFAMVTKRNAI